MTVRRKISSADNPPLPSVIFRNGSLWPLTPYDAEKLAGTRDGSVFDLKIHSAQSPIQKRYWAILGRVCKATEIAPRAEELHARLKVLGGLVVPAFDKRLGKWVVFPSSTKLESMTHGEFLDFYRTAMANLQDLVGFDPEEALAEKR